MPVTTNHFTAELRALLTQLFLTHEEAQHILERNDDHQTVLSDLLMCASFDSVPQRDLPDFIQKILALDAASHWVAIAMLTSHVIGMRAAISAGMQNMAVQRCKNLVLDAGSALSCRQRGLIQDLLFQFGVTVDKLRAAHANHDGCMAVFTPPVRALITRAIPTVPALLDHVLGLSPSLETRPAPTRKRARVQAPLEEPDHAALRCDETIDDDKTASGDHDGKTVSADSGDHDDPSGYTTPPPTKMSKLERFRLTCGPLKMPRE
jgi:hypothetical protein